MAMHDLDGLESNGVEAVKASSETVLQTNNFTKTSSS